jgi:hypothetical protein
VGRPNKPHTEDRSGSPECQNDSNAYCQSQGDLGERFPHDGSVLMPFVHLTGKAARHLSDLPTYQPFELERIASR